MIAALVLAAGRSVRMGRPKLLLSLADGRSMLAHVVGLWKAGGAEPVLVVMSAEEGVAEEAERTGAREKAWARRRSGWGGESYGWRRRIRER